jgi:hypothetical protein
MCLPLTPFNLSLDPIPCSAVQALIRQWEYQPIKRRVEKGSYCCSVNLADEAEEAGAGMVEGNSPHAAQVDMKPRVRLAGGREGGGRMLVGRRDEMTEKKEGGRGK